MYEARESGDDDEEHSCVEHELTVSRVDHSTRDDG